MSDREYVSNGFHCHVTEDITPVSYTHLDNEFKMIADAYNETITSLKEQMENNRKMTELLALAQTKQLESQFNPHFLYNTLENIRYMCRLEPETAERMVFSLSKRLRYSLDGSREQVTLKEDLGHLNNYLSILEKRFGSRFEYKINVEPECMPVSYTHLDVYKRQKVYQGFKV